MKRLSLFTLAFAGFVFTAFSQTPAINVVFIGDSITAGAKITEKAAGELKKLTPSTEIYYSNQGHSGATTFDFQPPNNRFFTAIPSEAKKLMASHPGQLVFPIMLGTNDSANKGPTGSPVAAGDYHDNLKKVIDQLLSEFPEAKFVLHHPIWYSPNTHNSSDYEGDSAANRLKSYFTAIESLVKEYQASKPGHVFLGDVDGYDYFAAHYKAELRDETGKNGIFYLHPNDTGAQSLAKFWATAIAKALRQ